jgi:hypothetical protein
MCGSYEEYAGLRRLRAQVAAAEALAARWDRAGSLPDGWRCAWDLGQAADELHRALAAARERP